MTESQMAVCLALADNDLNISKAARALYRNHSTLYRTIDSIMRNTGLNPLSSGDLPKLISGDYEPTFPLICRVCGKHFMGKNKRIKICSEECRKRADVESRERQYARNRAYKEAVREEEMLRMAEMRRKVMPCRIVTDPSLDIAEVNAKAKAAGLSYGQYVARCRK